MTRKLIAGLLLGAGSAALVLLLAWTGALETPELWTYDWRVRRSANPAAVHPDIVLVEINDTTIRDMSPLAGRWPWPRVFIGMLLDFLGRAPARVTAVDLAFLEPDRTLGVKLGEDTWTAAQSDRSLVDAVRRLPRTVLLADAVYEGTVDGQQAVAPADWRARSAPYRLGAAIVERPLILPPFQELTNAATALGHNFLPLHSAARHMPPFIRSGARYMPSLGVAAALLAGGFRAEEVSLEGRAVRVRDRLIPLVVTPGPDGREQLAMLIDYRAPALVNGVRPYTAYEARHLLYSENEILNGQKPSLDPAVFKDKVVFIGLTASGLVDVFNTPFGSNQGTMPGIQLHASIADSILSNRFIAPAPRAASAGATIGGAVLVGLMAALLPFAAAAAGTLLAVSGLTAYSVAAFKDGVWLDMAQPLTAMAVALFAGTAYRYFVEGAEKRVVRKLFGRYVSRDVYHQLLANPELAELGGKRRDMTVLFSDIRGFTAVTEKGDPEALVSQLNEYFSRMVDIVFRHHGTVDKFVGDMVMALFGAPVDDPAHAEHAAAAAVEMVKELGALNRKWAGEGRARLDIGIGINSGEMIAGNIGSSSIMSYTVIGDNVNLASRLESLNKDYATRIIVSEATRARLTGEHTLRPLGEVVVKGKTRPVAIFEITVPSPLPGAAEEATI